MVTIIITVIIIIMIMSVRQFLLFKDAMTHTQRSFISVDIFFTFIIIYIICIVGFGLIYFLLSLSNLILIENVNYIVNEETTINKLYKSLYFSGVTLLTIGYGDITPVGVGRFFAISQALFGYVLPTAFVLKLVQLRSKRN